MILRSISISLLPHVWRDHLQRASRGDEPLIGRARRNFHAGGCELIVDELMASPTDGRPNRFGPRDELVLMRLAERVDRNDARQMLAAFDPLPTQIVAALVLGTGSAAGQWSAQASVGASIPVESIRFVGPRMLRIMQTRDTFDTAIETPEKNNRYSRTRGALGERVWRMVRDSTVAIAGLGRNGSACAFSLARVGVGRLILFDDDKDDWHNLEATIGSVPDDVGKSKALNRAAALVRIRPADLSVTAVPKSLLDWTSLDCLRSCELLVTCVDRDTPRLAAAHFARRLGCLHLDIGTGIFRSVGGEFSLGADIRLCLPGEACVSCLGGLRDEETANYEWSAPPGALPRRPQPAWHEQRAGSLATINQVAVNLGVQLWLDLLAGRIETSRWLRLEFDEQAQLHVETVVATAGRCSICLR